jgi:hypothetical protein
VSGEVTKRFADMATEPTLLFKWPVGPAIMYCCIDRKLFGGMLNLEAPLKLITSLSCASVSTVQALPIALDTIERCMLYPIIFSLECMVTVNVDILPLNIARLER